MSRLLQSAVCPLIISALILLPAFTPPSWQALLEYQRDAIGQGEYWRIISGHLVHLSWGHLLLNLLAFWLIWELFLRNKMPISICLFGITLLTLGTTFGLYTFSPSIDWYRGMSGVLHGALVWALLRQITVHPVSSSLLLGLFLLKLIWEQIAGPTPGSEQMVGGRVIIDAHLYGGVAGALLWGLESSISKLKPRIRS